MTKKQLEKILCNFWDWTHKAAIPPPKDFELIGRIIEDNSSQLEPPVIKKNGGQEVCEQLIEILDKHIDLADASKMEDYRPYNDGAHTAYLVIKKLVEKKLRAIKGC